MPYATAADFIAAFPDEESVELTNLDSPEAIAVNQARITTAIAEAQAEIDTYVGIVATLPLATVPVVLRNAAIRIARYRLDAYNPREFVFRDYEKVVEWLKLLSTGKVSLGLTSTGVTVAAPATALPVSRGHKRTFTRESLQGYGLTHNPNTVIEGDRENCD